MQGEYCKRKGFEVISLNFENPPKQLYTYSIKLMNHYTKSTCITRTLFEWPAPLLSDWRSRMCLAIVHRGTIRTPRGVVALSIRSLGHAIARLYCYPLVHTLTYLCTRATHSLLDSSPSTVVPLYDLSLRSSLERDYGWVDHLASLGQWCWFTSSALVCHPALRSTNQSPGSYHSMSYSRYSVSSPIGHASNTSNVNTPLNPSQGGSPLVNCDTWGITLVY